LDLRHCDVCGGLVGTPERPAGEAAADVGLLCDVCLRTRRVLPDASEAKPRSSRFRCPHCNRRLRSRLVRTRVEIACPRCGGGLILLPGGAIEAGAAPPAREPEADEAAIDSPADSPHPDSPADEPAPESDGDRDGSDVIATAAGEGDAAPP
jgi:hypothetical protein